MTHRGTSNSNSRGSSYSRRVRKQWLLDTFGDGTKAPCSFECGEFVTFETITVDRYPIAGIDGGSYKRGNIRPACAFCNSSDGASKGQARREKRKETIVSKVPDMCEKQCLMDLAISIEGACDDCLTNYAHWCEVDNSEMDIDWSEYEWLTKTTNQHPKNE